MVPISTKSHCLLAKFFLYLQSKELSSNIYTENHKQKTRQDKKNKKNIESEENNQ